MPYPNYIVAASVVVLNDFQEVLLVRHPLRGWEMPQGRIEPGESIRNGAIREVKEESGIDTELVKYCGVYQNIDRTVCNFIFTARPVGGELTTSEESLEVGYFSIEEALKKVTWGNFRDRIERALRDLTEPFFIEYFESEIM